MIYLLEGREGWLVLREKQNIMKQLPEDTVITELDGSDRKSFSMRDVLDVVWTVSLFESRKAVVVTDPWFFMPNRKDDKEKDQEKEPKPKKNINAELLSSYCRKPNEECDLLFVCAGWNANKACAEYKVLSGCPKSVAAIISKRDLRFKDLDNAINDILKNSGHTYSREAVEEIRLRASGSISEIYKAIDSFDLYGKKDIEREDVVRMMPPNPEADLWRLGEALLRKDTRHMIRAYRDLKELSGYTDTDIIPLIASQIRKVYSSRLCADKGMNNDEIKAYTGSRTVYYDLENSRRYTTKQLLGLLSSLADLDQGIKTGQIEEKGSLENWLLNRI